MKLVINVLVPSNHIQQPHILQCLVVPHARLILLSYLVLKESNSLFKVALHHVWVPKVVRFEVVDLVVLLDLSCDTFDHLRQFFMFYCFLFSVEEVSYFIGFFYSWLDNNVAHQCTCLFIIIGMHLIFLLKLL